MRSFRRGIAASYGAFACRLWLATEVFFSTPISRHFFFAHLVSLQKGDVQSGLMTVGGESGDAAAAALPIAAKSRRRTVTRTVSFDKTFASGAPCVFVGLSAIAMAQTNVNMHVAVDHVDAAAFKLVVAALDHCHVTECVRSCSVGLFSSGFCTCLTHDDRL